MERRSGGSEEKEVGRGGEGLYREEAGDEGRVFEEERRGEWRRRERVPPGSERVVGGEGEGRVGGIRIGEEGVKG